MNLRHAALVGLIGTLSYWVLASAYILLNESLVIWCQHRGVSRPDIWCFNRAVQIVFHALSLGSMAYFVTAVFLTLAFNKGERSK